MALTSEAAARRVAFAILALAAAGCSSVQDSGPVAVKAPAPLKAVGFATDLPRAADFVQRSRGVETDFIPVGVTPPARALAPRKAPDVAKLQQELEATRQQHDALSGRNPDAASTLGEQLKTKKPEPNT
jgi:hypothetical protein